MLRHLSATYVPVARTPVRQGLVAAAGVHGAPINPSRCLTGSRPGNIQWMEIVVRRANDGDARAIARIHVDAWTQAFSAFLPADYLGTLTIDSAVVRWQGEVAADASPMFVGLYGGEVAGFLQVRQLPVAEVRALYVQPVSWRHGVGASLLAFAEAWLAQQGAGAAVLWTAAKSQQSRSFYEHRGWRATGKQTIQTLGDAAVALEEVEYSKALVR